MPQLAINGSPEEIVKIVRELGISPDLSAKVDQIIANQETSLMNEAEMKQALVDIDEASTAQGESLDTLSTAQSNLATDIEAFINKPIPVGGPSDEDTARAKGLATRAKAISAALKLQAKFSTDLAGKTEGGVVIPEVPVPEIPAPPVENPAG